MDANTEKVSTTEHKLTRAENTATAGCEFTKAIREYVRAFVYRHGQRRAAEAFAVSRHTLWRFLRRGHAGRSLPKAVINAVGGSVEALESATRKLIRGYPRLSHDDTPSRLPAELEDALLLLCATPLATMKELSLLGRVPSSTLKARLKKLYQQGLVDSASHRLTALGRRPQRRYFPTQRGIIAAAGSTHGKDHMLQRYPVSRRWFQLLAERLDAVAVLYHTAAMVACADPREKPVRVDLYRQEPYDMLVTLSEERSIGIMCQGPMLSTANLLYRLRSIELLPSDKKPRVLLVMTYSDQATRRAIRTLGDYTDHSCTFVATEGEFLAGDHQSPVWQVCGTGTNNNPPVAIDTNITLSKFVPSIDQMSETSYLYKLATGNVSPDPDTLYTSRLRATMLEPSEQLSSSLAMQLTAAEKQTLELLSSWPLCTKGKLAGLMGGVTCRRVNQILIFLTNRSLARADGQRHVLTVDGLRYLARRDRASVSMVLGRWSPGRRKKGDSNTSAYRGSSLRTMASQFDHHDAVTSFAAAITV